LRKFDAREIHMFHSIVLQVKVKVVITFCQTYNYLPSHKASQPLGQYHYYTAL